jgi:Lhr-like helicase
MFLIVCLHSVACALIQYRRAGLRVDVVSQLYIYAFNIMDKVCLCIIIRMSHRDGELAS